MKKKKKISFKTIVISAFIFLLLILAVSYYEAENISTLKKMENSYADLTENLFLADFEDFEVSLSSGYREDPYVRDGSAGFPVEFGVLSLIPKNPDFVINEMPSFLLNLNGSEYDGSFEKYPFRYRFASDIKVKMTDSAKLKVTIFIDGKSYEKTLTNVSKDWETSFTEALKIFSEYYEKEINENYDNKLNAEIYLLIIYDNSLLEEGYFWSASMYTTSKKWHHLIIDTDSNEILVANTKEV